MKSQKKGKTNQLYEFIVFSIIFTDVKFRYDMSFEGTKHKQKEKNYSKIHLQNNFILIILTQWQHSFVVVCFLSR